MQGIFGEQKWGFKTALTRRWVPEMSVETQNVPGARAVIFLHAHSVSTHTGLRDHMDVYTCILCKEKFEPLNSQGTGSLLLANYRES